jgi:hypothetical protein
MITRHAAAAREQLDFACNALFIARLASASITSWYRTESHNKAVGGDAESQHRDGLAVDFVPDNPKASTRVLTLAKLFGYTAIVETDHIHVQRFPKDILPPHTT